MFSGSILMSGMFLLERRHQFVRRRLRVVEMVPPADRHRLLRVRSRERRGGKRGGGSGEQSASFHWHFPPAIDGTIIAAKQLFVPTASWLPFSPEPSSSSMPQRHLVGVSASPTDGVADCHHERSASIL